MPQVINTNIMSLNAQRNLNRTGIDLSTSVQRLSSGLRINSAKDDAAGLAIATRMTTQVNGLSVTIRNANDGISIAQTAEGAMDEMVRSLIRANDLALQAASYNTNTDRASLNQEVSQLLDEMSRIVNQTRYNGEKLLTGGFSADIQVGTSVNETINVSVSNLSPTGLGVSSNYSSIANLTTAQLASRIAMAYTAPTEADVEVNGVDLGSFDQNTLSISKINTINGSSSSTGVTAFSYGNGLVGSSYTAATANVNSIVAGALVVNGVSIDAVSAGTTNTTLADNLVAAINAKTGQHGVTAVKVDLGGGAETVTLVNDNGSAITVTANTAVDPDIATFFAAGTTSVDAGGNGAIVLNQKLNQNTVTFSSGGGTADTGVGQSITGVAAATETLTAAPVNAQTVTTAAAASLALLAFQSALDAINSDRAILGAKLNRFESTIRNLENVRENVTAARSRIQDADFALETASLTRAQILQQAGTAMVAQANQLPQSVLQLLQG